MGVSSGGPREIRGFHGGISHGDNPYDVQSNEKPVMARRDQVSMKVGEYLDSETACLMLLVRAVFRDYDKGLCTKDEGFAALTFIVRRIVEVRGK